MSRRLPALMLALACGCASPTTTPPDEKTAPPPGAEAEVRNHRYWDKPLTDQQLDAIVKVLQGCERGDMAAVNKGGVAGKATPDEVAQITLAPQLYVAEVLVVHYKDRRPPATRAEAVEELAAALRRGPGKF